MMNTYQEIAVMRRRCETLLLSLLGPEFKQTWWNSPNYEFNGRTPEEIWAIDPVKVYQYVVGSVDGYW